MFNMNNLTCPENNIQDNHEDSGDNSDDNLQIVIDDLKSKRKTSPKPSKSEKRIIKSIEEELQKRLEEKATKTKLNERHVKNIIKHVVTNEHVLALVKKAENPSASDDLIPYEPKFTRAKAKELLSSIPITQMPWNTPKKTSEVQVLFTEELQEDSSGDEYIPGDDESEDDRDSSVISDPPSVPPPTPPTPSNTDSYTQTNWTDDGIFKIPPTKTVEEIEDEANISRRTRSKLCLSSTPLEVIEEAFIPPDITTDMYDMDCDNDDWMDFLKKFTRPLDEVARPTEDEEQDPEYNILADEEIDKIDKEELRVDRAVKVTKKELNDLIAELFEYSELCATDNFEDGGKKTKSVDRDEISFNEPEKLKGADELDASKEGTTMPDESVTIVINESNVSEDEEEILIRRSQIPLLEQQMRQHVQILMQVFILTYQHPEFHNYSSQSKEYLLNLKLLGAGKERSAFHALNLNKSLELVKYWESLLATQSSTVLNMKKHIEKTVEECIERWRSGNTYIPDFPELVLETISNSDVFLYPSLLPKIPFKPSCVFPRNTIFTDSEDQLIALGLEQFESILKTNRKNLTSSGEVKLNLLSSFIQEYIMPQKDMCKIYNHISFLKHPRCASNPIKFYFQYKKAPPLLHIVTPLQELQVVPPCKRLPNQLPYKWKEFNYPGQDVTSKSSLASFVILPTTEVLPVTLNANIIQHQITPSIINFGKSIYPKTNSSNTSKKRITTLYKKRKLSRTKPAAQIKILDPITKFKQCLSKPSMISRLLALENNNSSNKKVTEERKCYSTESSVSKPVRDTMLPSMPSLGTPIKNYPQNVSPSRNDSLNEKEATTSNNSDCTRGEGQKNRSEISTISSSSFQQVGTSAEVEFCRPSDCQTVTCKIEPNVTKNLSEVVYSVACLSEKLKEPSTSASDKDGLEFSQSSAVKPAVRKEPSGAEKKRAKLRKEFLANLSVSAPEDPEIEKQKNEMFALAYYDKMRETLELEDYHKVMQILNDHEEGDAVDLYKKIERVLSPKYQELADEFLLFLREKEAAAAGKLVPWITMNNRSKFLRKLETYFKDQPAQLRKIYKCLTELSQTVDISMEKIKGTLLPMFKGNAVLSDLFLQNFLSERPPPILLEGPYETIDVDNELSRTDDEEIFETITVPDVEDKYGGPCCICNCHQIEDHEFKSRYRHCTRCGTRFINGKVFIQSGRGLRPASVSFLTNANEDHNARLIGKNPILLYQKNKRSEASPSKQVMLSPTKENLDEETEDEADSKKKSKRKSAKKKPSDKSAKGSKETKKGILLKRSRSGEDASGKFQNDVPIRKTSRKRSCSRKMSKEETNIKEETPPGDERTTFKEGATAGQQKRSADESMEWDTNPGACSDLKANSPEQQTAESESEFCEESSQDNYCESDSNSSISSLNNQSQSDSNTEECSWKREEDKIILETFQKENDKEHAFEIIAGQLKNRTVPQISDRFQTLMALLLETLGNT